MITIGAKQLPRRETPSGSINSDHWRNEEVLAKRLDKEQKNQNAARNTNDHCGADVIIDDSKTRKDQQRRISVQNRGNYPWIAPNTDWAGVKIPSNARC